MRTYYIFNINKDIGILTKTSPYMLYKSLEWVFLSSKNEIGKASNLYEEIVCKLPLDLNNKINSIFNDSDFYMYNGKRHSYYNKYRDERCEMLIKNSYMVCRGNHIKPTLLSKLKNDNYFVCDFENKDYFWFNEIYC